MWYKNIVIIITVIVVIIIINSVFTMSQLEHSGSH